MSIVVNPKPVVQNRISYRSIGGIVDRLDSYLNQAVNDGSSPTFGNLLVTGDATIDGNLYVEGNTTVIDTNVSQYKTNILLLNDSELGSGVSLLQAGIEIDRGLLTNYQIIYDEITKTFRAGTLGATQPICFRENNPMSGGIMTWNNSTGTLVSSNILSVPIGISNTTDSTSTSTGSLYTYGGVGIQKNLCLGGDLYLNGGVLLASQGNLTIESQNNISLIPGGYVSLPENSPLIFGSTNQSMVYNPGSNQWKIQAGCNIVFNFINGINHYISIPNQVPITFSTLNEKVYTDSSNNMVMAGSQDIQLNPGSTHKVVLPVNTPLAFNNANQQISANANGDLTIAAGNNILFNLSSGYIRIPTNTPLKFGATGNQTVLGDDQNNLNIMSQNKINISSSSLNLSQNTIFTWHNQTNQSMISTDYTNGNLLLGTTFGIGSVIITNTTNATNNTIGSLIVYGGINAYKNIYANANVIINNSVGGLLVSNGIDQVFNVDLIQTNGQVRIKAGDGTNNNKGFLVQSNTSISQNLMQFNTTNDTVNSFYIGRDRYNNSNRNLNINIPSYTTDYFSQGGIPTFSVTTNDTQKTLFSVESDTGNLNVYGELVIHSSQDSVGTTSGSFTLFGGLGVDKNVNIGGNLNVSTASIQAVVVGQNLVIDTENNITAFNGNVVINTNITVNNTQLISNNPVIITNTTTSVNNSSIGALIVSGGVNVLGNLNIENTSSFNNTINACGNNIINVNNPINATDAANKAYVDLVKQGLFVKDSVVAATIAPQNLSDFQIGSLVDGYTLGLGDRLLIKNQIDDIENGIYIINNSGCIRSIDLQNGQNASGIFVFVENGNYNNNSGWICNTITSDIVGVNGLNFTQFSGAGELLGGIGISLDTNVINTNLDNFSIEIDYTNNIRLSSSGVGTGLLGGSGIVLSTDPNQSHVTQLGSIISGEWNSTNIAVSYGGTGKTLFNKGNILYGDNTAPINSFDGFTFDDTNIFLGVGIDTPSANIHVNSLGNAIVLLSADSDNLDSNANAGIQFQHTNTFIANTSITRNPNDIVNGSLADSFVIANNITSGNNNIGAIHLATNGKSQMIILQNGNVGINTSNPTSTLSISGSLDTGSLTVSNNLTVLGNVQLNSNVSVSNLYIGSQNLKLSNFTTTNIISTNISSGILHITGNAYLNNFILSSTAGASWITAPLVSSNGTLVSNSLQPIKIGSYLGNNPVATFNSSGVLMNSLQIGGYTFQSTNSNLIINPLNISTTGTLHIGTIGNFTNMICYGAGGSSLKWIDNQLINNLNHITLIGSSHSNITISPNFIVNSLNTCGNVTFQLPLTLSNTSGNNLIQYSPSTNSIGSFVINNDVNTTINGVLNVHSNLVTLNNGQLISLNNTQNVPIWIYLGTLPSPTDTVLVCNANTLVLEFFITVYGGSLDVSHNIKGNSVDSGFPLVFDIFQDSDSLFQLFALVPSNIVATLQVTNGCSTLLNYIEGSGNTPDGSFSGYNTDWNTVYSTTFSPDSVHSFGSVYTNDLYISSNIPVISHDNNSGSVNLGIGFQRYIGDILNDTNSLTFILPSQITIAHNALKITGGSQVDNYYVGFWIQYNSQILKVLSFNPALQVLVLDGIWNIQPNLGDVATFYSNSYLVQVYDEEKRQISLGYTNRLTDQVSITQYTNLQVWNLICNNLTSSFVSTGSLLAGSISTGTMFSTTLAVNDDMSYPTEFVHFKSVNNTCANILIEGHQSTISFTNVNDDTISTDIIFNSSGTLWISPNLEINHNNIILNKPLITTGLIYSIDQTGVSNQYSCIILDTIGNINITCGTFNIGNDLIVSDNGITINDNLIVSNSVTIQSSTNATSTSGALTVAGGISTTSDMYIGGDIYLSGTLHIPTSITSPSISCISSSNCTVNSIDNIYTQNISSRIMLTYFVEVTPSSSSEDCSFILNIPYLVNNLVNRGDIIINISGWTENPDNNQDVIPLFNTIGVGIIGTQNSFFKFQSISVAIHYLQVQCTYFVV